MFADDFCCLTTRAAYFGNGSPFGAAHYALLALTCAALLAPGIGEQVLVSSLVAQIRSDAAEQGRVAL